jgi:DNA mismatch repair protein MutL
MPVHGDSPSPSNLGASGLIQVDGTMEGMTPEDARLAIERHATSKIRRADDLERIATLGFRGEALPSIASCRTSRSGPVRAAQTPARRCASTAARVGVRDRGRHAGGATVHVADLFYNLPARRKFLKSDAAESAQVSRVVTQLALGYPEIGFTLTSSDARCCNAGRVDAARPAVSVVRRARSILIDVRRDSGDVKMSVRRPRWRSRGRRADRRTLRSIDASSRTGQSRTRSSTRTAWRRSRSAVPRCISSSTCRTMPLT